MKKTVKKIKMKFIEAHVLFTKPKNELVRVIFPCNSIESGILDLQEVYPDRGITRKSILNWKFLTIGDFNKLDEETKKLFNDVLNPERSVASKDQ